MYRVKELMLYDCLCNNPKELVFSTKETQRGINSKDSHQFEGEYFTYITNTTMTENINDLSLRYLLQDQCYEKFFHEV